MAYRRGAPVCQFGRKTIRAMPDHNYFGTHAAELDELTYHLIEGADGVLPQVIQCPEYRKTRAVDREVRSLLVRELSVERA